MSFHEMIDGLTRGIETTGVVIVCLGAAVATARFVRALQGRAPFCEAYARYREGLGRAILLGLEFLVLTCSRVPDSA